MHILSTHYITICQYILIYSIELEGPLTRRLRSLHGYLLSYHDIREVDSIQYVVPFLHVISSIDTNGTITGVALESVNKFLLYGFICDQVWTFVNVTIDLCIM